MNEINQDNDFLDGSMDIPSNKTKKQNSSDMLSEEIFSLFSKNNSSMMPSEELELIRTELIELTEDLYKKNNSNKPILIVSDWTYLDFKEKAFLKIYWEKLYKKYVQVVRIKYNDWEINMEELDRYFINNIHSNSLVILWWSVSDIIELNPSIKNSYFFRFLDDVIYNRWNLSNNNFLLWICYWHQLISHISWNDVYNCWSEFMVKDCYVSREVPDFYSWIYRWLTNSWKNSNFSAMFTRSWKVWTNKDSSFLSLLEDQDSFWNKAETFLSIQFHPEVPMEGLSDIKYIKKELINLWVPNSIFAFPTSEKNLSKSIDWHFFIPALHSILWKIYSRFNRTNNSYVSTNMDLINTNKIRSIRLAWEFIEDNTDGLSFPEREEYFNFLYDNGLLSLNSCFDRKVDRWTREISKHLWFKSITSFILHLNSLFRETSSLDWEGVFVVRDLWAWDWTFLEEAYKETYWKNILLSWVWDRIYIDLYKWIKASKYNWEIPDDVIKLFVKKFIQSKEELEHQTWVKNLKSNLWKIISWVYISPWDVIFDDSMFWIDTNMYSFTDWFSLSDESIAFIKSEDWKMKISELKDSLKKDFLWFVKWYFERIFVSDFLSYFDNFREVKFKYSSELLKTHFNMSVRWTSHLSNEDYYRFIYQIATQWLVEWWIFVDDWILRSYTFQKRIFELYEIQQKLWGSINIKVIFSKKNELKSVILLKEPSFDIWIDWFLEDWSYLKDISEVFEDPYYKIDCYITNFFSDYICSLFWSLYQDKFQYFTMYLKFLVNNIIVLLKSWDFEKIKENITRMIDYIWNRYLENIKNNKSLRQLNYLKNWYDLDHDFKLKIDWIVEGLSYVSFDTLPLNKEYINTRWLISSELLYVIDDFDESNLFVEGLWNYNHNIYSDIFEDILKKQRWVKTLTQNDINVFTPLINFLNHIDEISETWILEEFNSIFPYITPLLENKEAVFSVLWVDVSLDMQNLPLLNVNNEKLFWKNIKILIVDDSSSTKKVMDIIFTRDLWCPTDNITMLSNSKEWLTSMNKHDFDLVIVSDDVDINWNLALTNYMLENWLPLIYLWSIDSNIKIVDDSLQRVVVRPFKKDTLIHSIKTFEALVKNIISKISE